MMMPAVAAAWHASGRGFGKAFGWGPCSGRRRLDWQQLERTTDASACICLPLTVADKALGTLNIASPQTDAFRGCAASSGLPHLCLHRTAGNSRPLDPRAGTARCGVRCASPALPWRALMGVSAGGVPRRAQELVAFAAVLAPIIGLQRFRKELKVCAHHAAPEP